MSCLMIVAQVRVVYGENANAETRVYEQEKNIQSISAAEDAITTTQIIFEHSLGKRETFR